MRMIMFIEPDSVIGVKECEVIDIGKEYIKCSNGEFYPKAYFFPIEYKEELIKVLEERQKLKKAYQDSIGLLYELRNKVTQAGYGNNL